MATSELVVPRSMPTARRCWCGAGDIPGSEICSSAMSVRRRLRVRRRRQFGASCSRNISWRTSTAAAAVVVARVERARRAAPRCAPARRRPRRPAPAAPPDRRARRRATRAIRVCSHQEIRAASRCWSRFDRRAVRFRTGRWRAPAAAQRAVGLVGARRPLHGDAPLGVAARGEAVRMHLRLERRYAASSASRSSAKRGARPNSSKWSCAIDTGRCGDRAARGK